jgi:catechol 2,3-dioxygenase-like lactoylglutathione lyase family enzyme
MMNRSISGIHHVTAITANAQANIDFYCGVLGLRLVKLTVNFDDPTSYHLYYGDELGRPGSIMTFFTWPGAPRGRVGHPQVAATAFSVPLESIPYWRQRLEMYKLKIGEPTSVLGHDTLTLADPDGLQLELVASADMREPWTRSDVPPQHAIRGLYGVTLSIDGYEKTARLLTSTMGFQRDGDSQNRFRFRAGGGPGGVVDLLCTPGGRFGALGAGVVHHVAFRTPDDVDQAEWHRMLVQSGYNVSPVMDRAYFHSIYFREPGGVLFEIATDVPGFTVDEPAASLGTQLMLPSWVESARDRLTDLLPPLRLPAAGGAIYPSPEQK